MLLLEILNLYFLQSENLELRWRLYRQPVYNLDIHLSMYLKHIIKYVIQNTCHRWAWSWLSQAWNGVFINRYYQRGENNSLVNRVGSLWAPLLLHDVNRKVKPGIFLRNTNEPISVSWTGKKVLLVQRKHNKNWRIFIKEIWQQRQW